MEGATSFTSAMTLTQLGVPHVPQRYILPSSQRPNPDHIKNPSTNLPIIDLSSLQHPSLRSQTMDEIQIASKGIGFFQVINHGIPPSVMKDALDAATEFFNLPLEEKMLHASANVHEPVRYGTSLSHDRDEIHFWRDFIKHYSHPISNWIHLWPSNPPSYREKMGNYAEAVQVLQKQLMEVVLESLGLNPNYLQDDVENGSQVLAVNCYPACPQPKLTLGMPPHSDYGSLTILLQSCPGLQVKDHNKNWLSVPAVEEGLIVQFGDQMEVMSNGQYKSVIHRATVSLEKKRFSIASLHSFAMDKKLGPAEKLVDLEHPAFYKEFSFKDFLDYFSNNDVINGQRFIDTLKKNPMKQ
ncbi:flavanone 3-dioxygenase 3-like [Juglans microcarpa x Juglans regia]|uniref:flavanone 3-dioxygenase 3-like n=1 Tax=Juglans microcarpa x Juglans regia TaxID=2249226 RepID=UPI001B7DCFAF|nr:flavanone 3-dioxygenase 3-like [Juglans microcarpa x Juglans regia]